MHNLQPTAESINQFLQPYKELAAKHYNIPILNPTITFKITGRIAGMAYGASKIDLNESLLRLEKDFPSTVIHEFAHIVQHYLDPRSQAHGTLWQEVMSLFGQPAKRCHSYQTASVARVAAIYSCKCRVHEVSGKMHNRILKGTTYTCLDCGSKLVRSFKDIPEDLF